MEADNVSIDDFISQQLEAPEGGGETVDDIPLDTASESELAASAESVEGKELATSDEDTPEGDDETEGEPATQTITAPQSMSAKDREAFYQLPPEQQSWLAERVKQQEADYTRKTMELAEQRKGYEGLEKVLAPRRQQLAMDGMDESTAVGQLFALSDFANQDPIGFVNYLLQQRGIPLDALYQNGQQADPQTLALQRKLQGVENLLQQQQNHAVEISIQEADRIIADFAKDNPFYDELEADMVPIVQALRENSPGLSQRDYLSKAYKMALAANEEVSAKIESDRKAKEQAEKVAKAKADAAKAKKAASTNVTSRATLPPAAAHSKNVDEFIGALVDERMTA